MCIGCLYQTLCFLHKISCTTDDHVEPDFFTVELREGDTVLMCSDGLTNMLEDEEIRMIISGARDLVEKAESLVEAANANGGRDNISVILIEPCA